MRIFNFTFSCVFDFQNRMSKMVRKHLSRKYVLQDEIYLDQIVESQEKCETISFVVYILALLVLCFSVDAITEKSAQSS